MNDHSSFEETQEYRTFFTLHHADLEISRFLVPDCLGKEEKENAGTNFVWTRGEGKRKELSFGRGVWGVFTDF